MFDSVRAGRQIALLRKHKGITQEELAQKLSVSPQAISKWENGHTMPEVSLLVELSRILDKSIDEILVPLDGAALHANFEHILLPYEKIAEFSGRKWPRSLSVPAIISAIKLIMGLEKNKDSSKCQLNDDTEYVLQAAFTSVAFGYSWGRSMAEVHDLETYGLTCEVYDSEKCTEDMFIHLATENILKGYPIVVEPKEYTDTILATGFSQNGKVLKGLAFLDGDDNKNSVMSFKSLRDFPEWYKENVHLILIKPSADKISVEDACRNALREGYRLLSNEVHQYGQPLVGYGLVIYDNWCNELRKENDMNLEMIECIYPHIFIHYESKMRIKQFLELCSYLVANINQTAITKAISKYEEIIAICEKVMPEIVTEQLNDVWAAKSKRQTFIRVLQRSKELEVEALKNWLVAMKEF